MKKRAIILSVVGIILFVFIYIQISNYSNQEPELDQAQKQELAESYIRDNISDLSPEEAVLGGTFYVTKIEFTGDNLGVVSYEDGHKVLIADFEYAIENREIKELFLTNFRDI